MLEYAQTDSGRRDMGITYGKVVKVDYNSYTIELERGIYRIFVRCYPVNLQIADRLFGLRFGYGTLTKHKFLSGDPIYPSAGDGSVYRGPESDTWANVRGQATGSVATYTSASTYMAIANRSGTTRALGRSFFHFDTSVIGQGAIVLSGSTFHWKFSGWGADVGTRPTLTLVASTVVSNTVLAIEDYDLVGTTEFTATRFDTAGKVVDTDYSITLDADGDANISSTGFSKFAIRTDYDFDNADPTDATQQEILCYFSEQSGTGSDPYLAVTYASGSSGLLNKIW